MGSFSSKADAMTGAFWRRRSGQSVARSGSTSGTGNLKKSGRFLRPGILDARWGDAIDLPFHPNGPTKVGPYC